MRSEVHTEVINWIIQKKGFKSYLEIGLHSAPHNFDLIKCRFKVSVDPSNAISQPSFLGTSDEFFAENKQTYDLAFLDGLHHNDQMKKDFSNALLCLNGGGIILIHDTNPAKEIYTQVPRNGLPGRWNGNIFQFVSNLNGFDYRTIDTDPNGLTIVKSKGEIRWNDGGVSYEWFSQNKKDYLKLCTRKEFEAWMS